MVHKKDILLSLMLLITNYVYGAEKNLMLELEKLGAQLQKLHAQHQKLHAQHQIFRQAIDSQYPMLKQDYNKMLLPEEKREFANQMVAFSTSKLYTEYHAFYKQVKEMEASLNSEKEKK